jgi:hypothetical protein
MEQIERASFRFCCPSFADSLVRSEALADLQSPDEVVGVDEVPQVAAELVVGVVLGALDGDFLERPVHSFNLTAGPGVTRFGEAMINAKLGTGVFERMRADKFATIDGETDL